MEQDENILVLTDDKDQDVPFEILEEMTLDGAHYMVLAPLMEEEQATLSTIHDLKAVGLRLW